MPDEKSIFEKLEDGAKEIGKKVEKVLDEISADEEPLNVTYPEDANSSPSNKTPSE